MGPDKAWGAQLDLEARYRPWYALENFLSEALLIYANSASCSHKLIIASRLLLLLLFVYSLFLLVLLFFVSHQLALLNFESLMWY